MYNLILIIINRYTKILRYVLTVLIIDVVDLLKLFVYKIIRTFGTPNGIVTDYRSIFTSNF